MPTLTHLSPIQWRLLNHLHHALAGGLVRRNIRVLCTTEDGTYNGLVGLEEQGLIEAWLGDTPVRLDNLAGQVGTPEVSLTAKGARRVTGNPQNRVLRALTEHGRDGLPVKQVKADADVDDELLKQMDEAGLIEAPVSLSAFRRPPPDLRLRTTDRGRQYCRN